MNGVKHPASAALIGDLVRSRSAIDRVALHERLTSVLRGFNDGRAPRSPLRITVGDEFQGTFTTVGEALRASLALRLALLPDADVRTGIGWGEVVVLSADPRVEDGPAWWAARAAIEEVQVAERHPASRRRRTSYALAEGQSGPDPAALRAALMLRDELVGRLSERSVSVLRGLMAGRTQREIARAEGLSASAISQRVRSDGLAVLLAADEVLGGVS